jgi:hypothetical protein
MPDPTNNKPAPRRKGVQLKKDPSVKVRIVPKEELAEVTDSALSVKPSAQPIITREQEEKKDEDESAVMSIFGVGQKKKAAAKPGAPGESSAPAQPKKINLVSLLPKASSAVPPPAPKEAPKGKPSLLPPVDEEGEAVPVPATTEEKPVAAPVAVDDTSTTTTTEEKPKPKRVFKVPGKTALAQGPRPTLDGFTLTADEEELLTNLSDLELSDLAKAIMTIEKRNPYKTPIPADG